MSDRAGCLLVKSGIRVRSANPSQLQLGCKQAGGIFSAQQMSTQPEGIEGVVAGLLSWSVQRWVH